MKPLRRSYSKAYLMSLQFDARADDEVVARGDNPPITIEDNAFVSWWKPAWSERIRILCGKPVRVLVNYSPYGPLHLDTQSGWGSSR